MDGKTLVTLAQSLLEQCAKKKLMLATAESCTGGLVAMLLTEIAGSSAVYERGFITYSNKSKTESLGVDAALISVHGAVSKEVASAMAKGAIVHSEADLSVAITGVAGPEGSEHKPVGLVYIGYWLCNNLTVTATHTDNRGFSNTTAPSVQLFVGVLVFLFAADIGFVNLNSATHAAIR